MRHHLPTQLAHRDLDRIKGYRELLDFYHGRHWESRERRGERRLTFNYAKVFIDKVTSYLMSGINFAVDPQDDSQKAREGAKRAEQVLYQVFEANHLEQLDLGCEIEIGPGYTTTLGNETSPGLAFWLDGYEHTSSGGRASLILYASDGRELLENWQARHQLRWNKESDQKCVKDILTFLLARVGLNLEVKSASSDRRLVIVPP